MIHCVHHFIFIFTSCKFSLPKTETNKKVDALKILLNVKNNRSCSGSSATYNGNLFFSYVTELSTVLSCNVTVNFKFLLVYQTCFATRQKKNKKLVNT